jgi:hypothetical protein
MRGAPQAPGTYFKEESSIPNIQTVSDTVAFIVGLAEMGPMDEAVECRGSDFDTAFRPIFGGYTSWNRDTVAAVKSAYDNGATVIVFSRTCHHTDPSDPATKTSAAATLNIPTSSLSAGSGTVLSANAAPFNLEPGLTLVISVDGDPSATATFNAAAASRTAGGTGPFELADGDTLTVAINGGSAQTIEFDEDSFVDIAAATAAEVIAVINGQLVGGSADLDSGAPRIKSDKRGLGSSVNVTGGTANAELGFTTGAQAGTGNVQDIDAVTAAEVETIVEAAESNCLVTNEGGYVRFTSDTTGSGSSIQIISTSTADDELGLDNAVHTGNAAGAVNTIKIDGKYDGTYAHEFTWTVSAPSNGLSGFFNLQEKRSGVTVNAWANLSMNPDSPRYFETILNKKVGDGGSQFFTYTNLDAPIGLPNNVPANGNYGPPTGGNDGLTSLDDNDFVGGVTNGAAVGLRTGDVVRPHLVAVPQRATPVVANAMVTWCNSIMGGLVFPIPDPPAGYTPDEIATYYTATAALRGLTDNGAFFYPRIRVANPDLSLYGQDNTIVIPPSGMMLGLCARVDGSKIGGQFEQPAGTDARFLPRNVLGLETKLVNDPNVVGKLNSLGINVIRNSSINGSGPVFVDGTNIFNMDGLWPSIGQKRGMIFIERQLDDGLQPFVHRNIRFTLTRDQKSAVERFMKAITDADSLASLNYEEAFLVDNGPGMNTASTARQKQTWMRLGVATAYPNEFQFIILGQLFVSPTGE